MDIASEPLSRGRNATIDEAYVLKPISTTRRAVTASLILLPSVLLAGYGWADQLHAGTLPEKGWVYLAILAAAIFWAVKVWTRKEQRVLATLSRRIRAINPGKRLFIASALLAAALLGGFWYVERDAAQSSQYWVYAWPAVVIYGAYIVFLFVPQYSQEFTPAAKEEYARLQQAKQAKLGQPIWIDNLVNRLWSYWWLRYCLGAVLFWTAWEFAQVGNKNGLFSALGLSILAIACMKELFLPIAIAIVVGGVFMALYGVLAALPLSLAIIVGAAIIAQAMKK